MIDGRLSSLEAAERLGIKSATLYSYVSRGLLHPERTPQGSRFDSHEVALLSRSARNPGGPGHRVPKPSRTQLAEAEATQEDPVFVTGLTLIENGALYYRGLDAVALSRSRPFEEVAAWLWTGDWDTTVRPWSVPATTSGLVSRTLAALPGGATLLERFMAAVVTASLGDELRHDLNPAGVPVTGRSLLAVLAASLPGHTGSDPSGRSFSEQVGRGLSRSGAELDAPAVQAVESALVLAADHELAPSTLAARVAASFRADPYAVVLTGLGPASGSWYTGSTGAPREVEGLLAEAESIGPERAIGERLRRNGEIPHGFGMPLYPGGDPRGRELLRRLDGVGPARRREVVAGLIEVGEQRGFPPPNFDLGLGALSFCAGLVPASGQAVFTIGKVAGWLAHAIEEYTAPTRFRSRADYVGALPDATPGS